MDYFFTLRKDLYYKNQETILLELRNAIIFNSAMTDHTNDNVNYLLTHQGSQINQVELDKKVDKTDLDTIIYNAINNNIYNIQDGISDALKEALDSINSLKTTSMNDLNSLSAELGSALSAENSALVEKIDEVVATINNFMSNNNGGININLQQAIASINNAEQVAVNSVNNANQAAVNSVNNASQDAVNSVNNASQSVIGSVNNIKQAAADEIAGYAYNAVAAITASNIAISDDLLEKIDYIFEMFYHSDSKTIMDNYPL
jgi:hypothetical protein